MASIMPRDDEMEQALALSLAMSNLERPTRPERASVDSDTDQALREAMEASRLEAEETSAEDVAAQRALELAIKESLRPPEASLDDFGGPSMQGSSLELAIDLGSGGGSAATHTLQGGASGMYRSLAADEAQPYMGRAAQPPYMEGEVWTGSPHTPSPAVSLPPEEVSWDAASATPRVRRHRRPLHPFTPDRLLSSLPGPRLTPPRWRAVRRAAEASRRPAAAAALRPGLRVRVRRLRNRLRHLHDQRRLLPEHALRPRGPAGQDERAGRGVARAQRDAARGLGRAQLRPRGARRSGVPLGGGAWRAWAAAEVVMVFQLVVTICTARGGRLVIV